MSEARFDAKIFSRHVKRLYELWKDGNWAGVKLDALCFVWGKPAESSTTNKTVAVHSYLFQYELPDSAIIFTKSQIFVFAGVKKIELMRDMMSQEGYECAQTLELLQRSVRESNDAHLEAMTNAIKESYAGQIVGILDDVSHGTIVDQMASVLNPFERVVITKQISNMLAVKDEQELRCILTAASIAAAVMKNSMVTKMEEIIDEGKKVSQESIVEFVEDLFLNPQKISSKLNPNVVDAPFRPSVQSGGEYELSYWPPAFDEAMGQRELHPRCIILQVGARYKSYNAVVGRTYMVDPTKQMQETYSFLENLFKKVVDIMYPGTECEHIYKAAVDWIKENEKFKHLADHFSAEIGSGLGLELDENDLSLKAGNRTKLKAGMTFALRMGFSGLTVDAKDKRAKKDPQAGKYAVFLCDTVKISDQAPEILTQVKKGTSDVFYFLEEEEPKKAAPAPKKAAAAPVKKEKKEPETSKPKKPAKKREDSDDESGDYDENDEGGDIKPRVRNREEIESSVGRRQRTARALDQQAASEAKELKRKQKQKQLYNQLKEQALERLEGGAGPNSGAAKAKVKEFVAYPKGPVDFPAECTKTTIVVDQLRQSVLLPIHGMIVPFHISTIKSVSMTDSDLRIVFKPPEASVVKEQNPAFVKEAQFRIKNAEMLSTAFRTIDTLKKYSTKFEKEAAMKADLVEQEKLRLSTQQGPRLPNVSIRPTLGGGRHVTGMLEAHDNGFRYTTTKKATCEVMYNNIQHAFFQAADPTALIVLIHFHLKNPILIGKKKTSDVQFFTKVMEASEQVDNRRMGATYQDELEEEQRERQRRNNLNGQFSMFVKKMEAFKPDTISFDIPFRELGFFGVPSRNRVFLQPTVNCLVSIVEEPFFVLTLDDVEVAYFERVSFGMKQFELVFIKKDYSNLAVPVAQTFVAINAVPIEKLDLIKDWLNDINIKYYEGTVSLNWKTVLTKIREDIQAFWEEEGGWKFLEAESDSEDEKPAGASAGGSGGGAAGGDEESEEDEGDFVPEEDAESDEYSGSDDDESGYSEASDDDAPDSDDDDESAEDWSDHEERLAEEDERKSTKRKRDDSDESDNDRKKKRKM